MERALSLEDKIRKAEEIYYRRNNKTEKIPNKDVKANAFIKKITIQTLISACIFTGIFTFLNNDKYSESLKNNVNKILSYNINFQELYQMIIREEKQVFNEQEGEKTDEIIENEEIAPPEEIIEDEETLGVEDAETNEEISSIDQMTLDVQYIKENIALIKPLEGYITSRFGLRENVTPLYHTGIDIAANTGSPIIAAMDGVAEIVSTEGSYGKHIKITNGEVSTLYAHCSTLCINQGDYIKQGEKIAEVGSTGNATGPHLHFEILRNGEYVNPDLLLDF